MIFCTVTKINYFKGDALPLIKKSIFDKYIEGSRAPARFITSINRLTSQPFNV